MDDSWYVDLIQAPFNRERDLALRVIATWIKGVEDFIARRDGVVNDIEKVCGATPDTG